MCDLAESDHFRLVSLLLALLLPLVLTLKFGKEAGFKRILLVAVAGTALFVLPIAGSVLAVNHCAGKALDSFDANGDGVFDSDEQKPGYVEAESRVIGDGGRNVFALFSPAIGLVYVALLLRFARGAVWLTGLVHRSSRWQAR